MHTIIPSSDVRTGDISCLLHYYLYGVLTCRVGDYCTVDLLTIEGYALNALLLSVRMDGDLVLSIAELTVHSVVASCLRQTWIDADTIIVGLDTQDKLSYGVPHPGGCTSEP